VSPTKSSRETYRRTDGAFTNCNDTDQPRSPGYPTTRSPKLYYGTERRLEGWKEGGNDRCGKISPGS